MIMELYFDPKDVEKFKNFDRVFAYAFPMPGSKLKMLIDITTVKVEGAEYGLYIQRYRPSESTLPK